MSEDKISILKVARYFGFGIATLLCNHLIAKAFTKNKQNIKTIQQEIESQKQQLRQSRRKPQQKSDKRSKIKKWGTLKAVEEEKENDSLMIQLKQMDLLLFSIERIKNLIVDLKLQKADTIPCPLINSGIKKQKNEPYLSPSTIIKPGQFVVAQCVYRPGMTLDLEKKFLRAGPRSTQLFNPKSVKADIVCLGKDSPGMNTVVRQLVITLKNLYKVPKVTGIQYSFRGYYENKMVDLSPEMVETAHHRGGCFLGLSNHEFNAVKIVNSLVERQVNQVYLIGANQTLKACQGIYEQIYNRKLPIAICVILKGINRDVPIFDTCFGFQTAVEESCKILEKAHLSARSSFNGVSIVKLPGYKSGFLSCFAVHSVINVNICLVPEFQFDLYGEKGLISYICKRVKAKGHCTLVYAEGVKDCLRDCCIYDQQESHGEGKMSHFDNFLMKEIQSAMKNEKLIPQRINFFNGIELVRTSPSNPIDTKLCCQNAVSSVYGLMCGYTNFAAGHLANKNAMIAVDELILSETVTRLKETDESWQRLQAITGQPSFLN